MSTTEKNRGRLETRIVAVFVIPEELKADWTGIASFVQVTRNFTSNSGSSNEVAYFISSLPTDTPAQEFAEGIRSHWSIENSLHYVKDVTMGEDASKTKTKNAPQNISVFKNITINLFRLAGYDNMAQAIRLMANDIPKLWEMISA